MVSRHMKMTVAGFIAVSVLGAPAVGSAQSVVVECGQGQRAVMEQRRVNGTTQVVARCERAATNATIRPATQRSSVRYVERAPERTKTKTALMIAGSAATGAGVGAALKGKSGALIGAAIGGGAAGIYEAAKRR
jgi:hypothetical protein